MFQDFLKSLENVSGFPQKIRKCKRITSKVSIMFKDFLKSLINVSSNQVELNNNEAILFDRSRIHFSHTPVQSRYNFLGKLLGKLLLKKDDTYYRYICIDYVKE